MAKIMNGGGEGEGEGRGVHNKQGGWQKYPKLRNGGAGKNTALRNFIETKSSIDLVKISSKRT